MLRKLVVVARCFLMNGIAPKVPNAVALLFLLLLVLVALSVRAVVPLFAIKPCLCRLLNLLLLELVRSLWLFPPLL
jgi:hypothetical protein